MDDSSLQDIICCLGHPVFANPTQYVMQRAVKAAALDCRCLTLDVTPEQLEHAINGMRAMGFCGAILASPHETAARAYLDETRGIAADHNYVDLVYLEDGQLIGEATIGAAILALVCRDFEPQPSAEAAQAGDVGDDTVPASALILGDGARAIAIAKSFANAGIVTTVVADSSHDAAQSADSEPISDRDPGEAASAVSSGDDLLAPASADNADTDQTERRADETAVGTDTTTSAETGDQSETEIRYLRSDELEASQSSLAPALVVHVASTEAEMALPESATVAVDLTAEPVHTEFLRLAESNGCKTIDSVSVQLEMLVLAFKRWTGVEPDVQIMREALEEFLLV